MAQQQRIEPPLWGKRVCIDPGHPSEVGLGTKGKKLTEVGLAWKMALRLEQILVERGATVQLTKSKERQMVKNRDRARVANEFKADLMVRLHCDADAGTGTATFYPNRQGRAADGKVGPVESVVRSSGEVAPIFHAAMMRTLGGALKNKGCLPDTRTFVGGKQGALTGSIYSKVPVVLVEMCVLTNPKDEAFLASAAGFERMAQALADGTEAALTS